MSRVTVTYEDYRGMEHTVEGTEVEDPFLHRTTPEGAVDFEVQNDEGTWIGRVQDGKIYGLHHSTRRHDHRKGTVLHRGE